MNSIVLYSELLFIASTGMPGNITLCRITDQD
eukprot:COSAG02_NODE_36877_length_449_cov_0.977143_1_plen_31_part_10